MRRRFWWRRRLGSPQPGWGEVEDKELAEEVRPELRGERRRGVGRRLERRLQQGFAVEKVQQMDKACISNFLDDVMRF
jgi:hypothetical protein